MSMNRRCPNCYRTELFRFNFGRNRDSETKFHKAKWCDCGYDSPQEMMLDQDMGFNDPLWIPIGKQLLTQYHEGLRNEKVSSLEEQMRFFLKLLQSAANNMRCSIEIVPIKENEKHTAIFDGKTKNPPKSEIFMQDYRPLI